MHDQAEGLEGYVKAPVELPEVRILRLEPDDMLLFTFERRITDAEFEEFVARVKEHLPGHHKCMVLDGGMTLDILRRERNEAGEKQ